MFPLGVLKKKPVNGFVLDPAKVKLLLHFDGNFNDSSNNNVPVTASGNVLIDSTIKKFGSGSLQYGQTPKDGFLKTSAFFDFGNKRPFTLCLNYNGTRIASVTGSLVGTRDSAIYSQFEIRRGTTSLIGNNTLNNWDFVPDILFEDENWKHFAMVADGTNIKFYRDGVIVGSVAHPNWPSMMSFLQFGKNGDGQYSNGTLDEVLLYSEALWTSNFTPPTTPFSY